MTNFDSHTIAHEQPAISNALAGDIRFTSGNSALKIPFELYNNHIYLKVGVNGSQPLSFLFDTGAPHLLDLRQAKSLGLKLKYLGKSTGVGESTVDAYTTKGVSFSLPGVSLSDQSVGVLALDGVASCISETLIDERGHFEKCEPNDPRCQRREVAGILGHEFFKRFVVEIDYASRLINIYAPEDYKYQGTGESLHLEMEDRNVFVQARLSFADRAPVNGRFMIDTGGAHAVILTSPFVQANKLLPPASQLTKFAVCGIGGYSDILMGTLSSIQIGKIKINEPITGFSNAQSGNLADTVYDGNIGAAILRHFKVVLDYSRQIMILESPSKE
jgi:predicted aspartyl protease